ncbi:MAG: gamma-glutamyl phosphate reductase [Pseudomonadota bacterium]|jgi:glutamate-5-semialdehyde dehydrogenase|uniref:glutamate-5-semialdehyde dehydrogenase n=1 Tax=Sandarakinorhabdus limnophila TaxID=210512 RepID=UPI0026F2F91F|nr:glutamate-5-semialdehyde dehydrogenase [Sandarakinorhabdus limnophila]
MSLIADMARAARLALPTLAAAPTAQKALAIRTAADAIRARSEELLSANATDVAAATAAGMTPALVDRLALDAGRVTAVAGGVTAVAGLADPVGAVIARWSQPNGLQFERVRVPLGVIGIIYESRPGVTADAAALCLMAGNACLLRGGSEAARSNAVLLDCMAHGLREAGLPAAAVQMVPAGDRALVGEMLAAHGLIDVIIPRGGKGLVARVQAEARVPVLAHLDGINHVYVDASANPEKAVAIVINSKLRRTAVCGSMETLLIDSAAPESLKRLLVSALLEGPCEVRGDAAVQALDARVKPAAPEDWDTEYLDAIASVAEVQGVDGAIAHIAVHGSQHTDSIVAEDAAVAERFLARVDSAIVLHNASTQFADGGEFGFGAEIGIATGRLHARGPVALEGLTIFKTIVRGSGQVRP